MKSTTKKIILPTKGICNTTPPQICEDNELLDCVGLTFRNDALRPIQTPPTAGSVTGTLLYVHELPDGTGKNKISHSGSSLYSNNSSFATLSDITSVNSVGNTLIVNSSTGLHYFLWKPSTSSYISLGNKLPFPQLQFQLDINASGTQLSTSIHYTEFGCDIRDTNTLVIAYGENDDHFQAFSDRIIGDYAKLRNDAAKKSGFVFPFFVRYAVEMYDGTYIMPSNPILVCPSLTTNFCMLIDSSRNDFITMSIRYLKLQYKNLSTDDFSKWSDIISRVVIFATDEVNLYDTDEIYSPELTTQSKERRYTNTSNVVVWNNPEAGPLTDYSFSLLKKRTAESINKELESSSVFYKIAEVDLKGTSSFQNVPIIDKVLTNLTTQPTLVNSANGDDFYSHCLIKADNVYTYNRRLNVTNVSRSFFEGFKQFGPTLHENNVTTSTAKVFINTANGMVSVSTSVTIGSNFASYGYFYYPDPRAEYVTIGSYTYKLKKHPGLNGVYWFAGIDSRTDERTNEPSSTTASWEQLPNYLLQSEVDNPFTFFASGYIRVGQGTIIGLAALTTALSQDAYKVGTTLVFTTQGIWALKVADDGTYSTVSPPFSREVALSTADICMIDNGVFFVSEKGLMLITDDGIKCVSSHLAGRNPQTHETAIGCAYSNFKAFTRNCHMAYDYKNSLLWLTNSSYSYHWIYNIATGTFSRLIDNIKYSAIVPDYPDTILQSDSTLYSLIKTPDINDESTDYSCQFITRPLKFSESIHLKTIRELHNIYECVSGDMNIGVQIYASNDTYSWHAIDSLCGRGFKYFILKVTIEDMKAIDSYSGTIIGYDTRQTDKIR